MFFDKNRPATQYFSRNFRHSANQPIRSSLGPKFISYAKVNNRISTECDAFDFSVAADIEKEPVFRKDKQAPNRHFEWESASKG